MGNVIKGKDGAAIFAGAVGVVIVLFLLMVLVKIGMVWFG